MLREGRRADLTVLSESGEVLQTWVAGHKVWDREEDVSLAEEDKESEAEGAQFGQPRVFEGVATIEQDGEQPRRRGFGVNDPLSVDGTSMFLLGNGYAPVVTVRDPAGDILFSDAVTFLPQDNTYGSDGVIKAPAADPGLGFAGGFLPTIDISEQGMTSSFPGLVDPALVLTA